jgi:hypothetical protein
MAVFSTTVFAAPLSLAGSLDTTSSEFSLAGQTSAPYDGLDALFADVNAVALTDEEAAAIEGDGAIFAAIGAIFTGVVTVAIVVVDLVNNDTDKATAHLSGGAATAAGWVAATVFLPTP